MSAVTGRLLRAEEVDDDLAQAWDALPAGRGTQADFQALPHLVRRVAGLGCPLPPRPGSRSPWSAMSTSRWRCAAPRDEGRPVRGGRRTAPAADPARRGTPTPTRRCWRCSPARSGCRGPAARAAPDAEPRSRHPRPADGLRSAGYHVVTTQLSSDRLAPAPDGWEAYRTQLTGFDRYARRFANRLRSQWDVELELYGTPDGRPVAEGFRIFEEVQQRSWKQGFAPDVRTQWSGLFEGADRRGLGPGLRAPRGGRRGSRPRLVPGRGGRDLVRPVTSRWPAEPRDRRAVVVAGTALRRAGPAPAGRPDAGTTRRSTGRR